MSKTTGVTIGEQWRRQVVNNLYHQLTMNSTSIPAHLTDTFSAPVSEPITTAPAKLFSIGQIGVATFLAVPAGLALMALNFRRIGRIRESNAAFILAPIATVVLVLIGMALPEGTPTIFIPLLIALSVKKIAIKEFGDLIVAVETHGGSIESRWTVAGAIVAGIIVSLVVAVLLVTTTPGA
jgi:hypothetical protein